ncbi:hypothetical protein F5884DRAFT_439302 [Xylogone sp. PMI_703]|nr:hypothetical protein F5884DRAFT_439302 [Xylogone sp. PMI_703]
MQRSLGLRFCGIVAALVCVPLISLIVVQHLHETCGQTSQSSPPDETPKAPESTCPSEATSKPEEEAACPSQLDTSRTGNSCTLSDDRSPIPTRQRDQEGFWGSQPGPVDGTIGEGAKRFAAPDMNRSKDHMSFSAFYALPIPSGSPPSTCYYESTLSDRLRSEF